METSSLDVVLVGTYPPTECGIATYTANLRGALIGAGGHATVIRLIDAPEQGDRASDGVVNWTRADPHGVASAVRAAATADVVLLQHEFGIYPGVDGDSVVDFVQQCTRPVITVLHTVLSSPSRHQAMIVGALAAMSHRLVVHSEAARARLVRLHHLDSDIVAVIPHGAAPNLHGSPAEGQALPVVLTWGLLGPGKGIEYGIEAIALLHGQGIDVRYVVAGETHPKVRAREGEQYRTALQALAGRLGVGHLVTFDDAYRDWASLQALVRSASVVLVPYDSREQVTSGVLVEALAAGKPVVATEFPHAVELSLTGAVAVIDHGAPDQCARIIRRILTNPAVRTIMEDAARIEGARYDWSLVGQQFLDLARAAQRCDLALAP